MNKKLILLLLLIITLSACKREGCMDKKATNYESSAKKDCSCCEYEGKAVFWYNQNTAAELAADGAVVLTYYVGGQIVGSTSTNTYWTGSPDCGQNGAITVTKDLGESKYRAVQFQVKDQTGFLYFDGTLNFEGGKCYALELTW